MTDPYRILGITKDASNDDIKKAYRKLSRIYHPDANMNNPNKDLAEEKFKQIQEAYNQIMFEREHGDGDSYFDGFFRSKKQTNYQNESAESVRLRAAANYINSRHYHEAMTVLDNLTDRSAMWHYLHAIANAGLGNTISALADAESAVKLEPTNMQYQELLRQLQSGGTWYQATGSQYGFPNAGMGDCCMKILCFNVMCGCCC